MLKLLLFIRFLFLLFLERDHFQNLLGLKFESCIVMNTRINFWKIFFLNKLKVHTKKNLTLFGMARSITCFCIKKKELISFESYMNDISSFDLNADNTLF